MSKKPSKVRDSDKAALLPLPEASIEAVADASDETLTTACSNTQALAKQLSAALSQLAKTCEQIQRAGGSAAFAKDDLSPRLKEAIEKVQNSIPTLPTSLLELTELVEGWRNVEARTRRTR